MKRLEIISKVKRLMMAEGAESELDALLCELMQALPHGNISDLIFHPDKERTPEEIVEEAMQRDRFLRDSMSI